MQETGWVIERGDSSPSSPLYWAGKYLWSRDHLDAIRFARKVDAERLSAGYPSRNEEPNRVCEHAWS